MRRNLSSLITIFCAYIAFVIAGLGLQKMTEYDDFTSLARHQLAVGIPYAIVYYGSALSLLAVLVGGVPLGLAVLRHALKQRRWGIAGLFLIPPVALALVAGFVVVASRVSAKAAPGGTGSAHALVIVFLLAAIASAAAVAFAVWQVRVDEAYYRLAVRAALVTTGIMAILSAATLIAGLSLNATAPNVMVDMFSYYIFTWWNVTIIMALATLVAIIGAVRLRSQNPCAQSSPSLA